MTTERTIIMAREMLQGNPGAYARVMSGPIRAARSSRTAALFRNAVREDGAEGHFMGLDTDCPTAR